MAEIDVTAVPIEAATYLVGINASNEIVRVTPVDATTLLPKAGGTMTGPLILSADPMAAMEAATKQFVENLVQGLSPKASVRVATTGNITLSGAQTIDGVSAIAGNRILVKSQSAPAENGIYVVAGGAWARSTDANAWGELIAAFVFVEEGTVNADTAWVSTVNSGGVIGTTAVTFVQFGSIAGLAPLASPTFTGTPAAPTAAAGTSTTQIATTAFTGAEITNRIASLAEILVGTSTTKILSVKNATDAGILIKSSRTGSYGIDFSLGINFQETLTGNITLGVGTNLKEGQSGIIYFIQDATGSRTLTQNAAIRTPGGTDLVLSTAANSVDRCAYFIRDISGTLTLELSALEKDIKA